MRILTLFDKIEKFDELSHILESKDHDLVFAESALGAIKILKEDPTFYLFIACARILENRKPDILGLIKNDRVYRWVPIIASCVECNSDVLMGLLRRGISDIIAYPFREDVVVAKIARSQLNGRRRLVLIDDEPMILELLQEIFTREGYDVVPFSDAQAAMEYLKGNSAHAIISDIVMPGMNGIELLIHVKSNYQHIPVILITGFSGKYTPDEIISMGADGYFKKPFHNRELIATLEAVLMRYKGFNHEIKVEDYA